MLKLKRLNVWTMTQENFSKKIDILNYDIILHFEHQNYLPFVVEIDNSTWGWKNNKNNLWIIVWISRPLCYLILIRSLSLLNYKI